NLLARLPCRSQAARPSRQPGEEFLKAVSNQEHVVLCGWAAVGVTLLLVIPEINGTRVVAGYRDTDYIPERVVRDGHKVFRHPNLLHFVGTKFSLKVIVPLSVNGQKPID